MYLPNLHLSTEGSCRWQSVVGLFMVLNATFNNISANILWR